MTQFVDSHCHLHDSRISDCLDQILSRARNNGVQLMASCATEENNFEKTLQLSVDHEGIIPFLGIHPWFIDTLTPDWKSGLESLVSKNLCGVGETGLDFMDKKADRNAQLDVFQYHIDLAKQLKRPINIHIRKAWDAFIHLLKKMGPFPVPGLIHSYSGSADMIPVFKKYNLLISFSGSVTRPGAKKVGQALRAVSMSRFVLETDTPDIYPTIENPLENQLNEPGNLPKIAEIAANRKGMSYEIFCSQAFENSVMIFRPIIKGPRT